MSSEHGRFLQRAAQKAGDETHRLKILKAITTYDSVVTATKQRQFSDWNRARGYAAEIKRYVIENLPELLEQFETGISARGVQVLWAQNAGEARDYFLQIARRHNARRVVKSKSMTTEEIELNETCEQNGMEVLESDLGELIVQLAGEKPYHIVTPAMHKSKEEIGQLFHEKLGTEAGGSAEELTMAARAHLRRAYLEADIGVTGANFLLAWEGAVVMTENEGNGRLTMSCPPVHVVIAGLEKIIPSAEYLPLFLPLLATSGTGQQITGYNSIIRGPRSDGENDGPKHMYVILLDNGRSSVYSNPTSRDILRCIRCGACLNECPVYRTVGGHSYGTTYQGPVGSVLTPHHRGLEQWQHLSSASSLCGACTTACPVEIPIHELLLDNRWQAHRSGQTSTVWSAALKIWAQLFSNRKLLNAAMSVHRKLGNGLPALLPHGKQKRVPVLPGKTFAQWWEENEQSG